MAHPPITITVLAENTAQGMGLLGEHGLSLWLEAAGRRILFDTGQGLVLARNAERLGVPLIRADAIVLSHGHYDHTGGLAFALGAALDARLFLHPSAVLTRFACRDGQAREIGMPEPARDALERRRAPVVWTAEPTEVAPGVFVTGRIPRRNDFEDTGGPFFLEAEGREPDPLEDDQALWLETASGLVVLLGCAHAGVVNTLERVRELAGRKPIRAVVGGLHLGQVSPERMARTLEALRALGPVRLSPCHCTGAAATAQLMAAFSPHCQPCAVGTRLEF